MARRWQQTRTLYLTLVGLVLGYVLACMLWTLWPWKKGQVEWRLYGEEFMASHELHVLTDPKLLRTVMDDSTAVQDLSVPKKFLNGLKALQLSCSPHDEQGLFHKKYGRFLQSLADYTAFHEASKQKGEQRTLTWICDAYNYCGGLADRLKGMTYTLLLAMFSKRRLQLSWMESVHGEQDYLEPNMIDWVVHVEESQNKAQDRPFAPPSYIYESKEEKYDYKVKESDREVKGDHEAKEDREAKELEDREVKEDREAKGDHEAKEDREVKEDREYEAEEDYHDANEAKYNYEEESDQNDDYWDRYDYNNGQLWDYSFHLFSILGGFGIDNSPDDVDYALRTIGGDAQSISLSTNLEPNAVLNPSKNRGQQWIMDGLNRTGLAEFTYQEIDDLVGIVFRYLFRFSDELMTEVGNARRVLGLDQLKYTGVHLRTGFAGSVDQETVRHPKLIRREENWDEVLKRAVDVANRQLGAPSFIFLATDSSLVKHLAVTKYGSRFRTLDNSMVHLDRLEKYPHDPPANETEGTLTTWVDFILLAESFVQVRTDSGYAIAAGQLCSLPLTRIITVDL